MSHPPVAAIAMAMATRSTARWVTTSTPTRKMIESAPTVSTGRERTHPVNRLPDRLSLTSTPGYTHVMTQTEKFPTVTFPSGWTATAYPQNNGFKVICISPDERPRKRAIHIDRLTAEQVAALEDPANKWGGRAPAAKVDVMAALTASIDAVKAAKVAS